METECSSRKFDFEGFEKRSVVASFDGGAITSDAGALLLRETDRVIGLTKRVAKCFTDHRDPERVEHAIETLVAQRIHGIALDYEDSERSRRPASRPGLGALSTTLEPRARNVAPLAGKSTLQRLEACSGLPQEAAENRQATASRTGCVASGLVIRGEA